MTIDISSDDARFLRDQIRRRVQDIDNELVHTDKRELQHALAVDLERLRAIEARIASAATSKPIAYA